MSVSEYIEKTELAAKVEAAVNEAVKARPDEPLSFLVSVFLWGREEEGWMRGCAVALLKGTARRARACGDQWQAWAERLRRCVCFFLVAPCAGAPAARAAGQGRATQERGSVCGADPHTTHATPGRGQATAVRHPGRGRAAPMCAPGRRQPRAKGTRARNPIDARLFSHAAPTLKSPHTRQAKTFAAMAPPAITKVEGRQIIDSRGNPTVEADVSKLLVWAFCVGSGEKSRASASVLRSTEKRASARCGRAASHERGQGLLPFHASTNAR
jgi:hypothetical protein